LHVTIDGEDAKQVELTLDDLRTKFQKYEVLVTLQCAGNRRDDMDKCVLLRYNSKIAALLTPLFSTRRVQGLGWGVGGIGTAKWGGAKLVDVLRFAGFSEEAIAKARVNRTNR